jgi:hypothetical protein
MLAAGLNVKTLTLSMDDVPIPEPGPGQVRVKVRAAGVCLSDVRRSLPPGRCARPRPPACGAWAAWVSMRSCCCAWPGPPRSSPSIRCPPPGSARWTSAPTSRWTPPTQSWPSWSAARPAASAWRRRSTSPGSPPYRTRPWAAWARPPARAGRDTGKPLTISAITLALLFGMFSLTNGAGLIMQGIGLRKNRQTRPSIVPHRKAA